MRSGTVWAPLVPTAPSTGAAGQRHQIPILMQEPLDSFWQKGLFPVPCNDSVHQEIFNPLPGLKTNLFSPSHPASGTGRGSCKARKGDHHPSGFYSRAHNLSSQHVPHHLSYFKPPLCSMQQVTPRQMSHVGQESLKTKALPPLQEQASVSPSRHLHDPL